MMTPMMTHSMMVSRLSVSTRTRQRFATRHSTSAAQTKPMTYAKPYQRTLKGPSENATGSSI